MDEIDDILASVSGPRTSQRTLDLQALTRAWVAERAAPEVLSWPGELVERVMYRVRLQVCIFHRLFCSFTFWFLGTVGRVRSGVE